MRPTDDDDDDDINDVILKDGLYKRHSLAVQRLTAQKCIVGTILLYKPNIETNMKKNNFIPPAFRIAWTHPR